MKTSLTVMERAILRFIQAHPEGTRLEDLASVFHIKDSVTDDAILKIHQVIELGSDGVRVWVK